MSIAQLPPRPSLEHLKRQAQDLYRACLREEAPAMERVAAHRDRSRSPAAGRIKLADAMLVLAREYGFASWAKLKRHVELARFENDVERRVAGLFMAIRAGDADAVERSLARHRELSTASLSQVLSCRLTSVFARVEGTLTPLHVGAETDDARMVELVLDAGGDPLAISSWGQTALEYAALIGSRRAAPMLLARAHTLSLATWAALGDLERVRAFFDDRGTLAAGTTILRLDRAFERFETVDHWAGNGERVSDPSAVVSEAFVMASRNGHVGVAAFLLDRGAAIDHRAWGRTPIAAAAVYGHAEMVAWLIEHGADPSPVAGAAAMGAQMPDRWGADHLETLRAASKVAAVTPILGDWIDVGALDEVRRVLDASPELLDRLAHGSTPLCIAAFHGHTEIVRELLRRGASPALADESGATPFEVAVGRGHSDTADLLADAVRTLEPR